MGGRVMVTGAAGLLGSELVRVFADSCRIVGATREDFDVRDREAVLKAIEAAVPSVVIHAAAFVHVDECESQAETAHQVNTVGALNVAEACRSIGARMVYISTDYVFDGRKGLPYVETDTTDPVNVYGRSKLEGERTVLEVLPSAAVVRVSWLYGAHGAGAVAALIRSGRARRGQPLAMPVDQRSCPTWTREVARQILTILDNGLTGVIHCAAQGSANRFEFARAVFEGLGLEVPLVGCSGAELRRPAPRPANSSLSNARLKEAGIDRMRPWRQVLDEFLAEHGQKLAYEIHD